MSAKELRAILYQMRSHIGSSPEAHKRLDRALDLLAQMHPAKYAITGRPVTFGDWTDGYPPHEPPGRYYTFDDDPNTKHWISSRAMPIRCEEIDQ